MDLGESIARHREELSNSLRVLRTEARLSGSELSRRLGWSQSRMSRIETGRQLPTADELKAIAKELQVPKSTLHNLLAHLQGVEQEWSDARTFDAIGAQQRQSEVQALEQSAKEVRIFQPAIIPGLLQTPDYLRALNSVSETFNNSADVESDVEVRLERQKVLKKGSKKFTFIVTEAALWNRFGSGFVMHEQYEHLLQLLNERVRLAIIPRSVGLPLLPLTGFNVFDDVLVTIETITSELFLMHPSDVEGYRHRFEALESAAVTGRAAKRLIQDIDESVMG